MTTWLLSFHTVLLGPSLHDDPWELFLVPAKLQFKSLVKSRWAQSIEIWCNCKTIETTHRSHYSVWHWRACRRTELGHTKCATLISAWSGEWKLSDRGESERKLHCLTMSNCLMPNLIVLLLCVLLVLWLGLLCNINEWGCCCCGWWEVLESVSPIKLQ